MNTENVSALASAVIGHRIVTAAQAGAGMVLTLDNGQSVTLAPNGDCCAYTELEGFWFDPAAVDHMILGVGTTEEYTTWHIFADFGDVMRLKVGWSAGNTGYYVYGFYINVEKTPLNGPGQ